jgi:hypothetical protein
MELSTCGTATSHAERKVGIMRIVLRWLIVISVASISYAFVSGLLGWEPWESLVPVFIAATFRIVISIVFLVTNPEYPWGNALLVALMFVLSSVVMFDTEAVESGRFMLYLILPMVLAGAILPPRAIIVVAALEASIVIIFVAAMGYVATWLWYTMSAYAFITGIMYITAKCMHDLVERLLVANRVRMTVINTVTAGLEMSIEEEIRANH